MFNRLCGRLISPEFCKLSNLKQVLLLQFLQRVPWINYHIRSFMITLHCTVDRLPIVFLRTHRFLRIKQSHLLSNNSSDPNSNSNQSKTIQFQNQIQTDWNMGLLIEPITLYSHKLNVNYQMYQISMYIILDAYLSSTQ